MKHHESMIQKIEGIHENESIIKCIKIMIQQNVDMLPIVNSENKLIGVVTEGDFAKILRVSPSGWAPDIISSQVPKEFSEKPISSIMSKETVYLKKDEDFESLLNKMLSKHTYKRVPVVDNDLKLIGYVRLVDIVNKILEQ